LNEEFWSHYQGFDTEDPDSLEKCQTNCIRDYITPFYIPKLLSCKLEKTLHKGILGFILYCQDAAKEHLEIPKDNEPAIKKLFTKYSEDLLGNEIILSH
jgi:hypothetical protein